MPNKRLRALITSLIMVIALLVHPAAAFAAPATISISADKTDAQPGDVVTFTVSLSPVKDMGTMQMVLVIPDGLTYVAGSGKLAKGLGETLGFDSVQFTEGSKMINGYGTKDYASDSDTLLATFQCTVDEGFEGTAEVGLTKLEFYSSKNNFSDNHTSEFSVSGAAVTVAGTEDPDAGQQGEAPSGQPSEDPGKQSEDPGNQGSEDSQGQPAEDPDQGQQSQDPAGQDDPDKQSEDSKSDDKNQGGNTTPDDKKQEGSTTPDSGKNDGNKGQDGSKSGESDKQGSEGNTEPSKGNTVPSGTTPANQPDNEKTAQKSFPIWAVIAAAVVVIAALLIALTRKKKKD